jgi:integrase
VTVTAASAKSRRVQTVDLHDAVLAALVAYRPEGAASSDRVVLKGSMPSIRVFWADLAAAGIQRHDAEGRVVDFHALRTTFVSWLAMTGAHPSTAQALARHASITTTMERYTDLRLVDLKGVVGRLPVPGPGGGGDRSRVASNGTRAS